MVSVDLWGGRPFEWCYRGIRPGVAESSGLIRETAFSIDPPREPRRQIVVNRHARLALPQRAPDVGCHTLSRSDQRRVFDSRRLEDTVERAQMETQDPRHGLRIREGGTVESLLGFL